MCWLGEKNNKFSSAYGRLDNSVRIEHPKFAPLWIEEAVKEGRGKGDLVVAEDNYNFVKESERVGGKLIEMNLELGWDLCKEMGDWEMQAIVHLAKE